MKTLLIDDLPHTKPVTADRVALTFEEGMAAVREGGWDIIYLDHDLGDENPKKTGYDILCFLEANPELLPGQIKLVTRNPVGWQKMQPVIDRLYGRER